MDIVGNFRLLVGGVDGWIGVEGEVLKCGVRIDKIINIDKVGYIKLVGLKCLGFVFSLLSLE